MNNVSDKELYDALKTISDLCKMYSDCQDCPLFSGAVFDGCIPIMEGAKSPNDWELVAPNNRYHPFAQN